MFHITRSKVIAVLVAASVSPIARAYAQEPTDAAPPPAAAPTIDAQALVRMQEQVNDLQARLAAQERLTQQTAAPAAPAATTPAPASTGPAEPFAFGDFTWLNGNNRQHKALLDSQYFSKLS